MTGSHQHQSSMCGRRQEPQTHLNENRTDLAKIVLNVADANSEFDRTYFKRVARDFAVCGDSDAPDLLAVASVAHEQLPLTTVVSSCRLSLRLYARGRDPCGQCSFLELSSLIQMCRQRGSKQLSDLMGQVTSCCYSVAVASDLSPRCKAYLHKTFQPSSSHPNRILAELGGVVISFWSLLWSRA